MLTFDERVKRRVTRKNNRCAHAAICHFPNHHRWNKRCSRSKRQQTRDR